MPRLALPRALCCLFLGTAASPLFSAQINVEAPPGSSYFANVVRLLSNGNFVVTGSGVNAEQEGAVYLFDPKRRLISTLVGGSAVTGYGREEDRQRTRSAGFDHHLVKPLDTAQLAQLIVDSTRNKRAG